MTVPASKAVLMIDAASTTNAATATGIVDTKGFDFCSIDIISATTNDTTNNPTVFNLLESDDTVVTNAATISGFVGDTDWTIPTGDTANTTLTKMDVDCRGRKRYLRLNISPLTTVIYTAIANLGRGEELPKDATSAGVGAYIAG